MSTRSISPGRDEFLAYDLGLLSPVQEAEFFQRLVDTGGVEQMSSGYTRRLNELVEAGEVFLPDEE